MRRLIIAILCLLTLSAAVYGGNGKHYIIGFYNLENLFDCTHDEGKNDYQFLPEGTYKWTPEVYAAKLHNMAYAIQQMAIENGQYHAVLGVAEVENDHVLDDLVATPELAPAKFSYVHFESPDQRGIDVALLYRPDVFKVEATETIPFTFDSDIEFAMDAAQKKQFFTRDVLMVRGRIGREQFAFFVAHLPSRIGDKGEDLRCRGAEIIYARAKALSEEFPGIKIVVMGDMNDDPTDKSMTEYIHAKEYITELEKGEFFSPFLTMFKEGREDGFGTLEYHGAWNLFDIILVSESLVNAKGHSLRLLPTADNKPAAVFKRDFLTQQSGKFAGTPFRTMSYGEFINGYSDHYPTFIVIGKH